jgi:hypothetical protein
MFRLHRIETRKITTRWWWLCAGALDTAFNIVVSGAKPRFKAPARTTIVGYASAEPCIIFAGYLNTALLVMIMSA